MASDAAALGCGAAVAASPEARAAAVAPSREAQAAAAVASYEDLALLNVKQPFRLNNVALKWIRDSHEDPPGRPTTHCVDLTNTDPLEIGVIEKNTGMAYNFKQGERQPWSWREMLAALRADAKNLVFGADAALGVVRITCEPVEGSYDHKRCHAARHIGRPFGKDADVPVWDFFVTRTDATIVRFHTNYNDNKVQVAKVGGPQAIHELPKPPTKGKGKSDGRGTYKRLTQGNYDETVRSPQTHSGGGDVSAVAEPPPPGLGNDERDRNDGWRSGWKENAWSGWRGWKSGWQEQDWGARWQDRGAAGSSTDKSWWWQ